MSRPKAGKKKVRTVRTGPVTPRVTPGSFEPQKPVVKAEVLPAGGLTRPRPAPKPAEAEPEEKAFYGETGPQMLGRVRRELRNIAILAVISFGVGMLVIQFVKI